jgi:hypothetical protein
VLVGNPPWLSYRFMSAEMQKTLRAECQKRGLWAGGKVATHQDLGAYFFVRCMELYLRPRGKVAFVLPYATMTRQQYRGFITKTAMGTKGPVEVPARRFTEAWIFDETVAPLFNIPSCVLFAEGGLADDAKLPATATAFSGELPMRDASAEQAERALTRKTVAWPSAAPTPADSAYAKRFRQGATVVPRRLFVVVRSASGRFGTSPDAPVVESRQSSQEKEPWRSLPPLSGPVEREFLRPLYLGESIAPFRVLEPALAVIPWSKRHGLLDAGAARKSGYVHVAQWLARSEELWIAHRRNRISLNEQLDYYGKLSAQLPAPTLRVLYSASGTLAAAALLADRSAIVEHKLYWGSVGEESEARYLISILNSETHRERIAPQQSRGQWGARDFDKLLVNSIPQFESSSALHTDLARSAARAEKVAANVALPETMKFVQARQKIREALRQDGISAHIDKLVAQLIG